MLRLFIAILIPPIVKDFIDFELKKIKKTIKIKANYLPMDNWHFTLIFLGNKTLNEAELIKKSLINLKNNFVFNQEMKEIYLEKIILAPPEISYKRMIWLTVLKETNKNLEKIKDFLLEDFKKQNLDFIPEKREFNAHLTLARFQPTYFKNLPFINKELKFSFQFSQISLMQSILKKPNAEYKEIFKIDI